MAKGQSGKPERATASIAPFRLFRSVLLGLPLFTAACISPVDYGDIPHGDYVANVRCNPENSDSVTSTNEPFFLVTSRLPDCRADRIKLLNHRGDRVRFGRFGEPVDDPVGKGKSDRVIPTSLSNEAQWWQDLSKSMGAREGRVLLYVHGFRETFFSSSKDAAQMARLTGFGGPVIQYSWPSQGQFLKYAVDETNMYWDERNFRKFLMKLAQQEWTKEIVLVSHSLGARLVLPAVEYVDENSSSADASNISNIILASPDVDKQDFERDIADEILSARRVNRDRRITVYASSKDRALALSADIHGYPRLGIPRCFDPFEARRLKEAGLPERCYGAQSKYEIAPKQSGLTIIDTTAVSIGRSGHSDYLRSAAACLDFAAVINGERDRKTGRDPTHLPHVFALPPYPKGQKPDHIALCRRNSE